MYKYKCLTPAIIPLIALMQKSLPIFNYAVFRTVISQRYLLFKISSFKNFCYDKDSFFFFMVLSKIIIESYF